MVETIKRPQQGEIWLVRFKNSKESPKTFRPALVISGNIQNELNDLIAVVPLTTDDIENIEPFEVYIKDTKETGLDKPSKIQFIHPFTIDKELRLVGNKRLGVANKEIMEKAKRAWQIAFDTEEW
jgi:mRNA-degrading endonuclease toxin of MazEF toxin-antitoxin module